METNRRSGRQPRGIGARHRLRNPNDLHTDTFSTSSVNTTIPNVSFEDEFLREAELFFSNLESNFLWPFLQQQFFLSPTKLRRGWVSAVRFLVEHLPIDTYPDVRGCHLPQMVSGLTAELGKRIESLTLAEVGEFVELLAVLISQIQEVSLNT